MKKKSSEVIISTWTMAGYRPQCISIAPVKHVEIYNQRVYERGTAPHFKPGNHQNDIRLLVDKTKLNIFQTEQAVQGYLNLENASATAQKNHPKFNTCQLLQPRRSHKEHEVNKLTGNLDHIQFSVQQICDVSVLCEDVS